MHEDDFEQAGACIVPGTTENIDVLRAGTHDCWTLSFSGTMPDHERSTAAERQKRDAEFRVSLKSLGQAPRECAVSAR